MITRRRRAQPPAELAETERLAALAAAGDNDVLGDLYEMYLETILNTVVLKVGDEELAWDLTSDAWLRIARTIQNYRYQPGTRGFVAWIHTVAANVIVDHYRTIGAKKRPRETLMADMFELAVPAPDLTPEENLLRRAAADEVKALLDRIPRAERECVLYRHYAGYTTEETAEVMGRSTSAIKALRHRALRRIEALALTLPKTNSGTPGTSMPARRTATADTAAA